jgi:hypothetical protein
LQVRLLTVNDVVAPYAEEVAARMRKAGIRVEVNGQATINKLIRWGRGDGGTPGWCVDEADPRAVLFLCPIEKPLYTSAVCTCKPSHASAA